MAVTLYPRQKQILNYINMYIEANGHAPTLTEIRDYIGVKALSTVHAHMRRLEEKGLIEKDRNSERGISLILKAGQYAGEIIQVPLVGMIAAGQPIEAIEELGDTVAVPANLVGNKRVYALRVKGDSMIEHLIADGDTIIVEKVDTASNGDIVVALLEDGGATLKEFHKEKDPKTGRNYVRLQPKNKKYEPIIVTDGITIQGKLVGVYRKY